MSPQLALPRARAVLVAAAVFGLLAAVAAPTAASAATFAHTTDSTLTLASDLTISSARYDFADDSGALSPGDGRAVAGSGTASAAAPARWSLGTNGRTSSSTLTARIDETGAATQYWVRVRVNVSHLLAYSSECTVHRGDPDAGGVAVDYTEDSPYICTPGPSPVDPELGYIMTSPRAEQSFALASYSWATVRGTMTATGSVSLDSGIAESVMDRFVVDGDPIDHTTTPGLVTPGRQTTWMAERRNGEGDGTAKVNFAYRVLDDGAPTSFWVRGSTENWRGAMFNHVASCEVLRGATLATAVPSVSPYHCDWSGSNVNGRGDWRADFTVSRASIIELGELQSSEMLSEVCAADDAPCLTILAGDPETYAGKTTTKGVPYTNTTDEPYPYSIKYASSRSDSHSFEVTTGAEAKIAGIYKLSIELTYSYEQSSETELRYDAEMTVPAHSVGWFDFAPSYLRYTGHFMFEKDGQWYRTVESTYSVPNGDKVGTIINHVAPISGSTVVEAPHTGGSMLATPPKHAVVGEEPSHAVAARGSIITGPGVSLDSGRMQDDADDFSTSMDRTFVAEGSTLEVATGGSDSVGMAFAYRVVADGEPTEYWVSGSFFQSKNAAAGAAEDDAVTCAVHRGDPQYGAPTVTGPFTCSTHAVAAADAYTVPWYGFTIQAEQEPAVVTTPTASSGAASPGAPATTPAAGTEDPASGAGSLAATGGEDGTAPAAWGAVALLAGLVLVLARRRATRRS